ncbi:MAG: helix-turn-helix domain-containing protein [Chitinophagales bacterium]|nr:helix-turn-helix domain-containing protein [Chitinophagaceae bacterium]MCB9065763.1 helix-turn-helix domain-containing protein [Chitinophagales bacterium]
MLHVSIIIPRKAILASLEGTRQILQQVNNFMAMQGAPAMFDINLVGLDRETKVGGSLFTVYATGLIDEVKKTDLIIIPAVDGDLKEAIDINKDFLPWLVMQHAKGAEIASLCVGAFLLASTGLVDGKKCATHWVAQNQFRIMFPQVNLVTEQIITEENGIYSSGGAFSYLNLILHLVEKHAGREMAMMTAKVFAIEIERNNQSRFIMFNGQKDHDDDEIRATQDYIENNYTEKLTVDLLASTFSLGRRSLERRFKKATANTVTEYIQRVKIEAAKKNLENSRKTVAEVMYEVGYSDNKAFRNTFKKIIGLSPIEYKNRYNKEAIAV